MHRKSKCLKRIIASEIGIATLLLAIGVNAIVINAENQATKPRATSSTDTLNIVWSTGGSTQAANKGITEGVYTANTVDSANKVSGKLALYNNSVTTNLHMNIGQTIDLPGTAGVEYTDEIGYAGGYVYSASGGKSGGVTAYDSTVGKTLSASGNNGSSVVSNEYRYNSGFGVTYKTGTNGASTNYSCTTPWGTSTDISQKSGGTYVYGGKYSGLFWGSTANSHRGYTVIGQVGEASYIKVDATNYLLAAGASPGLVMFNKGGHDNYTKNGVHADTVVSFPSGYGIANDAGTGLAITYDNLNREVGNINYQRVIGTNYTGGIPIAQYNLATRPLTLMCGWTVNPGFSSWAGISPVYPGYSGCAARDTSNPNKFTLNNAVPMTVDKTYTGNPYARLTCNRKYVTITNPTRTGYTFNDWTGTANAVPTNKTGKYEFEIKASGQTITANWTANKYKITYAKGSTNCADTLIPADTACTFDSNVTLRGKGSLVGRSYTITFDKNLPTGCTTGSTYSVAKNNITGNLESNGKWTISSNKYDMGGALTTPNFTSTSGGTVTATAGWNSKTVDGFSTPTMDGYIFDGWYDAATGGNKITSLSVAPATTAYAKTLYAHWTPITYTVNLHGNKPSNASNALVNQNPSGWTWSTNKYTATFTFDAKQTIPTIGNTYTLVGWDVTTGWYDSATAGTNYNSGAMKWNLTKTDKDTVDLYVHWTANTYEVRLYQNKPTEATNNVANKNPAGWTWNSADGGYYSKTFTYDSESALPELKSTYTLVGWERQYGWCTSAPSGYLENTTISRHAPGTKKWNLTTTNNGTVKLYMGYIANTYTVTYDGNDNWNTSQGKYTQTLTYDKYETLTVDKFNRNAPTPGRVYNGNAVDSTGKPLKEGYAFVGWSHNKNERGAEKWSTDAAGKPVLPANTEIKNQSNARWNYTTAQGGNVTLYAIWKKNVSVTFNFTNGAFKGEKKSVTINYDMYNAEYDHVFDITEFYGKIIENGANSILQKSDSNGTNYRFLGYNINASEKNSPEPRFDVYSGSRNNTYTVADNQTIYAVWEPILKVSLNFDRVLGTLQFTNGMIPKTSVQNITAITGTENRKVATVIRPGEQGKYEMTYFPALESNKKPELIAVKFDKRMNAMYNDSTAPYYDKLNPVNSEALEEKQKCGLNRLITNPETYTLRKFYVPNYLGTSQGPYQAKVYNTVFLISQPSYYYKNYVDGVENESIDFMAEIYLSTKTIPGSESDDEDDVETVLNDLRAKLKICLY